MAHETPEDPEAADEDRSRCSGRSVSSASTAVRGNRRTVSWDPDLVARWVAETCTAQGIPSRVIDPVVLAKTATLLGATTPTSASTEKGCARVNAA